MLVLVVEGEGVEVNWIDTAADKVCCMGLS